MERMHRALLVCCRALLLCEPQAARSSSVGALRHTSSGPPLATTLLPSDCEGEREAVTVDEAVAVMPPETAGCLTMHFETHPALAWPRLRMSSARAPVTDEAIDLLFRYSLAAIARDEPFTVLWDLRECSLPHTAQMWRCVRWGTANKAALDERMASLVVVLGEGDRALRGLVSLVLKLCIPKVRLP